MLILIFPVHVFVACITILYNTFLSRLKRLTRRFFQQLKSALFSYAFNVCRYFALLSLGPVRLGLVYLCVFVIELIVLGIISII